MRRTVFLVMGLLEFALAGVLIFLGCQLPRTEEVTEGFDRADRVTGDAANQVRILRRQITDLRRPELQQLAQQLQTQTRIVTTTLRDQQIDFETVESMRDALQDVSKGLDSVVATLDPAAVAQLSLALGETADFLDKRVIPAAEEAADSFDRTTAALKKDAEVLKTLVEEAPLDLSGAREIHDSLERFGQGLEKLRASVQLQRLQTMREGFSGIHESLSQGADQVSSLASYSYPVVTFRGLRPEVSQKQFWPEGDRIADGMRMAARGVVAAQEELDSLAKDLPQIVAALDESRKIVDQTRQGLAVALKQQEKLAPLLRDIPTHTATLADALPRLGDNLTRVLRDTRRLKAVATALRQTQKGIDSTAARWPELRTTLARSSVLIRATGNHLDQVLENRQQYENAMQQTVLMAESFAALLPLVTDQLDNRLDEEERALSQLGQSLVEVQAALPVYSRMSRQLVLVGRILTWLVAVIVALHGTYLWLSVRLGRRFSF